ncbi:1-aminocyclopropane-1-carboxylate deaminase/D-cysteine desulfhydrase [Parapedobacter sp. 10938]|uniref:1-aminocyclopropane-1-carboxylate deaminase/D-cysteine desulfhydrase n=1 Tax=Parapedobacter flavus TaxID=3110225 RepID=UPI002DB6E9B3|nr:pyridoxal-phosphate dependent enzyme [Parapedobacter sp. 10938]MEC3880872.1 pyridoxal-phosphate dependent enzyme [Parapedobacter sp. 10938]
MVPFDIHSPVETLDFSLFDDKSLIVDIKRDDKIHPFISGNKWRKLKYVLQSARHEGKTHLVTFGGAWSNHLLATACAGATFGFKTTGFVRGEAVSNPNLSLCKVYGMELHFVDRTAYRDKHLLYEQHTAHDPHAYFVDEGGYSPEGAKGCAEIIDELPHPYDHIFCACGTGTTIAGLHAGCKSRALATQVHGISVLAGGDFIPDAVRALYPAMPLDQLTSHTDYHFGGYAKTSPVLSAFIREFTGQTGILIEPVYTGKLLYGVFDLVQRDYFERGDRILIIHTGGLTGILGLHEQLV